MNANDHGGGGAGAMGAKEEEGGRERREGAGAGVAWCCDVEGILELICSCKSHDQSDLQL